MSSSDNGICNYYAVVLIDCINYRSHPSVCPIPILAHHAQPNRSLHKKGTKGQRMSYSSATCAIWTSRLPGM